MGKTKQESGDCPLTFPTLEVIDHHLRCPVFRDCEFFIIINAKPCNALTQYFSFWKARV